jgi:tetratricopeptide (TPR) repeat protein
LESAIRYYDSSAATGSREPIVIAFNKSWRGRPISEVAQQNADKSRKELSKNQDMQARVARLNLRGVSAMNRNDRKAARDNFQQAYKLDPKNSFAVNNMGYLAELEGDTETAQSYYEQAQRAERARQKVMVSTRPEVEGQTVGHVAEQSTTLVESAFVARAEARRRSGTPPALKTRDNRTVVEPKTPPPSTNTTPPEFRRPPQDDETQAVPAPQSDQPQQNQPPANNNEPQLKTRPAQQPSGTQPPPDSQQQNAPQQNNKPPQQ